jgi:hypothetical protein
MEKVIQVNFSKINAIAKGLVTIQMGKNSKGNSKTINL